MQLPEPPPPPLAPLWARVLRAQALPPDLDVQLLYIAIRDRLTHSEWEVRLHALRVLADVLPISGNALAFPFDQVIDNLGHSSPNVRKAALDALKVFCSYCEDTECAARSILDKCSYNNVRPRSADFDAKTNIITGLILSIPSAMGILKRRNLKLDLLPVFSVLGDKLLDTLHRDVALRSLIKLRRVCGPRDFMVHISNLDQRIQDKFRLLCEVYDEDSLDVYYAPRKAGYYELQGNNNLKPTEIFNTTVSTPLRIPTDSSSDESFHRVPFSYNSFGKVIIETEIKFDSDTAITMTVLEENETETESERNDRHDGSEDDCDSSSKNELRYSDGDSEDTDVVVKKVRFGGESIKIRTPDSENQGTSEEDHKSPPPAPHDNEEKAVATSTPAILNKAIEIKNQSIELDNRVAKIKKSGIPLPVIHTKTLKSQTNSPPLPKVKQKIKRKSKSLSELYDYFRSKNGFTSKPQEEKGFALTLTDVRSPEKVPSPVEPHKAVEVLHNLQRSPNVSPRRRTSRVHIEHDGLQISTILTTSKYEPTLLSPRPISPIRGHYEWEDIGIVPLHIVDQLHNKENWILTVKAADLLHNVLLDEENVRRIEPAASSLAQHMWGLSEAVPAAKAPAEGAVCALFRAASDDCARRLLPTLVSRMAREPPPAAVPHALLQRLALHHLVDMIFDPNMIGISGDTERMESGQLRAALCLARAAGPAAVLSAVRRRLARTTRADTFCQKLRDLLNRPVNTLRQGHVSRISQLPVPVRRRARSTPPPSVPHPPRRLRPLPDSAPLPGVYHSSQMSREELITPLTAIAPIKRGGVCSAECGSGSAWRGSEVSVLAASPRRRAAMLSWCCRSRAPVAPAPAPATPVRAPDLVADLPSHTRDSSATTSSNENGNKKVEVVIDEKPKEEITDEKDETDIPLDSEEVSLSRSHHTPSLHLEDISENAHVSPPVEEPPEIENDAQTRPSSREEESLFGSKKSLHSELSKTPEPDCLSRKSSPSPARSEKSYPSTPSRSRNSTPAPVYVERAPTERDVRTALSECIVPAKHEDWEVIVNALIEIERLSEDPSARAPAASWRAAARSTAGHVRSLRSRVARAACSALGSLFEHRGRALDPELEEAVVALLERCADVNKFLRADAAEGLSRLACGGSSARAAAALARRGAGHRAGPVRAAAAAALARLVAVRGAPLVLDLPPEPRALLLRAAGELLADASADARQHARSLCAALSDDLRFKPLLKEAMTPSRYKAIEKYVDKLRVR